MSALLVPLVLVALGLLLAVATGRALARHRRERRHGRLVAVDRPGASIPLSSERYRLVGRPDVLRRTRDGALVPIEIKRSPTPRNGPWPSHVIQVAAYCLLVEETTGRTPPYGVLRYGDGGEFRIAWDDEQRRTVTTTLRRVSAPYDGAATPSRAKCRGCAWRSGCDASAA